MAADQAPPSLGFSRKDHWSGLPFPSPLCESEKWSQSCPILSNPMDYSPPGSSIHGIFQARILEWGTIAFSIMHHGALLNQLCLHLGSPPQRHGLTDQMQAILAWDSLDPGTPHQPIQDSFKIAVSSEVFLHNPFLSHLLSQVADLYHSLFPLPTHAPSL